MASRVRTQMKPNYFIEKMQLRTAITSVGPSAMRGQGEGVLGRTHCFLGHVVLSQIPLSAQEDYAHWLNDMTDSLLDALGIKQRPWGTSRKALNLFMRDVMYNQYLNAHFGFGKLEPWLEVPLDSAVAKGLNELHKCQRGHHLAKWPGLKDLKPDLSRKFQDFAYEHATRQMIERVHLDAYLWPANRKRAND